MLAPADIQNFSSNFHGQIIKPGDAEFDAARRVFTRTVDRRPALVARCADIADVVSAVRFAREKDLRVSIRGAGHSAAGNAVCDDGLMIDLSRMKAVEIDAKKRTAKVQPGVILGEFDRAAQAHGLATTLGVATTTGVTGLTLGGGLGWLMGKFGLACDNLIGAEVLTASGEHIRADANQNADLFWGLRGGGGNFGVVASMEFRLHPVGPVLAGMVLYPLDKAKEVLRFYREFTSTAPDELTAYAALLCAPDGTPLTAIALCYCGEPDAGEQTVQPLRKYGSPIADLLARKPYTEHQTMFDATYPYGQHFHYWKSMFLQSASDTGLDAMVEQFKRAPGKLCHFALEHLHGAAARVPASATAFPHRRECYNFLGISMWETPAQADEHLRWIREFGEILKPYSANAVYSNYLDVGETPDRVRTAFGPNYARLEALKSKYDPENFFRMNQNIKPQPVPAD